MMFPTDIRESVTTDPLADIPKVKLFLVTERIRKVCSAFVNDEATLLYRGGKLKSKETLYSRLMLKCNSRSLKDFKKLEKIYKLKNPREILNATLQLLNYDQLCD